MVAVPFPLDTAPGLFSQSGGRLINAYAEKQVDGRIARRRVPGLRNILNITSREHWRGAIEVNNTLLVALDNRLVAITKGTGAYSYADLGALPGTGPAYFARNNKTPTPDIVCVTDGVAYECTTGAAPVVYSDADVGSPNSVTFLRGYFVFSYGDARMRSSGLNSVSINTLDTAFAESKPDGLLRVVAIGADLFAFGPQTTEVWRVDPNNDVAFPFSYLDTIPRGIASGTAVAGFEDGWANVVMFLGDDGISYRMDNYRPTPVSTPAINRLVEGLADKSAVRASVYMHEGHPIWVMSCDDWTLCYDLSTGSWHERASHLRDNWRASGGVKAFGEWLCGDEETGAIYLVDPDYAFEGTSPLVASVISSTISGFPARAEAPRLEIDITAGVGSEIGSDPIQTNPKCLVSWSIDGGVRFGKTLERELGRQGQYTRRVVVSRLGLISNKGLQVRVDCSDPVPFCLYGADIVPNQRAA